jgi:hypothetical protein
VIFPGLELFAVTASLALPVILAIIIWDALFSPLGTQTRSVYMWICWCAW